LLFFRFPENGKMNPYALFDRSGFPLITVTFTGERETPENFQAYLNGLLENYDRQEPFSLVFDASQAATPNPTYQLKQAQWMKAHEALIKAHCRGVAYVVPNPILRQVLKLIFRLQANPVPFQVFSSLDQGKNWALEQVK
jgi:hypothetical protein